MPPVTQSAIPAVTDLAAELAKQLNDGRAARASVGGKDVAFAWTTGMPPSVLPFVNGVTVEGSGFTAVVVGPSGTPAGAVAEGAPKPSAAVLTSTDVPLTKYAGLATYSTEKAVYTDSLTGVVGNVLVAQAYAAFNAAVVAAIDTAATDVAAAADWTAALLGGIAEVIGAGGNPTLALMNPADYVAAVTSLTGSFVTPSADAIPSLFGLGILLSPSQPAGRASVIDPAGVTCGQHDPPIYGVVDPYTGLTTNAVTCAAELFAGVIVTAPSVCASVSKTP